MREPDQIRSALSPSLSPRPQGRTITWSNRTKQELRYDNQARLGMAGRGMRTAGEFRMPGAVTGSKDTSTAFHSCIMQ